MAYKNQKKNKRHIKELRKDPMNWRNTRKKLKKQKEIDSIVNNLLTKQILKTTKQWKQ